MVNTLMTIALDSFIMYLDYKHEKMIIIGTTHKMKQFKMGIQSEIERFSKEYEEQIKKEIKTLGWFTKHETYRTTTQEYPNLEEESKFGELLFIPVWVYSCYVVYFYTRTGIFSKDKLFLYLNGYILMNLLYIYT